MLYVSGLFDRKGITSKPFSTLLLTSMKDDFWVFPVLQLKRERKKEKRKNNKNIVSHEKNTNIYFHKKKK